MKEMLRRVTPFLALLAVVVLVAGVFCVDTADARSKSGGKSFSMGSPSRAPSPGMPPPLPNNNTGSMTRGLAGGLLGGALGGLLLGSMFGGGGGHGIGILPLLLIAGVGYFLYKKFTQQGGGQSFRDTNFTIPPIGSGGQSGNFSAGGFPPPPPPNAVMTAEDGIAQIRQSDRDFDPAHFVEVASDVFFQVQAGWMRRDLDSYRHLLGDQLATEYAGHFAEMRAKGVINKLESIAIRNVSIVAAGSTGTEDFITVLFTANLLDYTVKDTNGELVEGSMTVPVKFAEEWTWARPVTTQNWRLEAIKVVE